MGGLCFFEMGGCGASKRLINNSEMSSIEKCSCRKAMFIIFTKKNFISIEVVAVLVVVPLLIHDYKCVYYVMSILGSSIGLHIRESRQGKKIKELKVVLKKLRQENKNLRGEIERELHSFEASDEEVSEENNVMNQHIDERYNVI